MGFTDDVREALINRIGKGKRFPNNKRMADELGVDPSQLNRFLKKERGLNADSLGHILDKVGATIAFDDEATDAAREVCLCLPGENHAGPGTPNLRPEDYLAVPVVPMGLAATHGNIPDNRINGWMFVWRQQQSFRAGNNLAAVETGSKDFAMAPTLHPGDMVLIDRNDHTPSPAGKIVLMHTPAPDGQAMIRRVSTRQLDDDLELVFYSDDNRQFPPVTYSLKQDFHGDITQAIRGSVAWAWSDLSQK